PFGCRVLTCLQALQRLALATELLLLSVVPALQCVLLLLLLLEADLVLFFLAALDDGLNAGNARQEREQSLGLAGQAGADDTGILGVLHLFEAVALGQVPRK